MLRRSLGMSAPVVLTLTSVPVAAGQCLSASAFISAATFASRQPVSPTGSASCTGASPDEWGSNPAYWPGGVKSETPFQQEFGSRPLTPGFDENTTLLEVLEVSDSVEAHVTAALLNAHRGGMTAPFDSPTNVLGLWANIRANGGYYRSGYLYAQQAAMTPEGTLDWLALTWKP
ncbi:hypothetical protein [Azohydromonas caseinilytica]|uniref:Uncharacterized protein n=1 Tax=Azohydromonas caseinilytica TaxID=2728836 RepID=A0A848FBQ2_9BURK|nr:hypothetical protein [Azohydromonas caseinilytica]NML15620.1 hypothetical protein [Azohydromonas caseinilytica]